jgi:hypothetical protein
MLGPLAAVAMVIVFTIFILIGREDLRNRFIRLAGGRLNVMTQGLDEATQRINRYLFLQLVVNSGFGVLVGGALHFIGIPNAWLWGVCAAILRFLLLVALRRRPAKGEGSAETVGRSRIVHNHAAGPSTHCIPHANDSLQVKLIPETLRV